MTKIFTPDMNLKMNNGKRFAIVIGITEYETGLGNLRFTKNDAVRLNKTLLNNDVGFCEDSVHLFLNDTELQDSIKKPTRSEIISAIQSVCDEAGEDDLILFYFAGHGTEISEKPYLLTSDTKMNVVKETAIDIEELNEMFKKSKSKFILRIFDACRNSYSSNARGFASQMMTDAFHNAIFTQPVGWATISSCSSGEFAYETEEYEQGIFSYFLCEGLAGSAVNSQGNITLDSLLGHINSSMSVWSKRGNKQTPHNQVDISGELVFCTINKIVTLQEQAPTESVNDPFAIFRVQLNRNLASVPSDIRRLTFTDSNEHRGFIHSLNPILDNGLLMMNVDTLTFTYRFEDYQDMRKYYSDNYNNHLLPDMNGNGVDGEFCRALCQVIDFTSSEVVVPNTVLTITTVRFKFFYWLWYLHSCPQQENLDKFSPKPSFSRCFFTLKPNVIQDEGKIEKCLNEIFFKVSENILNWNQQLQEYAESRISPLRKIGKIIE
jgi:hypothetical protein